MEGDTKMHALSHIALGAAVVIGCGSFCSTSALATDREITVVAPLERTPPVSLDKALGVGPRFKFSSAPPELSPACALSIRAHVNEGEFVGLTQARTVGEFHTYIAKRVPLTPSEAERGRFHESFTLGGEGRISGVSCSIGPEAGGGCFGTISGSGYTIVYSFNPVVCRYDNIAVAKALVARLSVGDRIDREREPDCATKLEGFITRSTLCWLGSPETSLTCMRC
jgi:hypothetical protein